MDGGVHQIKFKISIYNPTLKDGWEELQQYHHFPDNVDIIFGYYGNNLFKVIMFREIFCCTKIPAFHSRSMYPKEVIIHISDNDLNTPSLVLYQFFKLTFICLFIQFSIYLKVLWHLYFSIVCLF